MTNFRHFQAEESADDNFRFDENGQRFPKGKKTLWEKEKLLITSNFSISLSVFKRLVLQTRKNQGLFGKGLMYLNFYISWFVSSHFSI